MTQPASWQTREPAADDLKIQPLEGSENGGLQRAFEALSENQQRTLRLHFFEGYTFGEIASELGQSTGNIRHHYFRGLNRLRKQIFDRKLQGP
jgi:RNA polymerase sigma factor (sigma-70 family)